MLFDEDNIKELIQLYNNIIKTKIFKDEILCHRFFQIFNREFIQDVILDAFIILEYLFTRRAQTELTYRLSTNGALFLSSNWSEFEKNQNLLKDLYKLRSIIVHGGNWKKKVDELKKKYSFEQEKAIINTLKGIV